MELPVEKQYSYADLLSWDESIRAEIISGKLYMMTTPYTVHQAVLGALAVQVWNFLSDKPDEVYMRPFGVRLFERDGDSPTEVDTYVEPDIVTVLDTKKLDKMGCI